MTSRTFPVFSFSRYKKTLWIIALFITLLSAYYQRKTGPTYPLKVTAEIDGETIQAKFLRTQTVGKPLLITIHSADAHLEGFVTWKRYKSYDPWQKEPLKRIHDNLIAELPSQPPAGKLIYSVVLITAHGKEIPMSGDSPIIARYKGDVPIVILLPHIVFMFLAMFLSNRTALETFDERGNSKQLMYFTIATFTLGGMILGPLVQKFAFGQFWTGIPFGFDLTDNKTLIAFTMWLITLWKSWRSDGDQRGWIFIASLIMLAIYLIPHSLLGSELDYRK